jgi:hypothetical protein
VTEIGHLHGVSARTVRAWISEGKLFLQFLGVPAKIRWTRGKEARRIDDNELERAEP